MPKSHGTRRSHGAGRRRADVPRPRKAPDARGPGLPDPYGFDVPPHRPEPKRRLRRALTSNITIAAVAIGAVGSAVVLVDVRDFVKDDTKPPKMAAADLSTNDMLAKLTSASDMDPVAADAIAAAKKRAYEEHQRELKRLKEKARREAKARAELKAGQVVRVVATDPGSVKDFQAFAKQTGNELLRQGETEDKAFEFFLRRK